MFAVSVPSARFPATRAGSQPDHRAQPKPEAIKPTGQGRGSPPCSYPRLVLPRLMSNLPGKRAPRAGPRVRAAHVHRQKKQRPSRSECSPADHAGEPVDDRGGPVVLRRDGRGRGLDLPAAVGATPRPAADTGRDSSHDRRSRIPGLGKSMGLESLGLILWPLSAACHAGRGRRRWHRGCDSSGLHHHPPQKIPLP